MRIKKLELLEEFQFFSDPNDETSTRIVSEIEFIDEIGDELEKSATTFPEIDSGSARLFHFAYFFHFMAGFWLDSASSVTYFDIYSEYTSLGFEPYEEKIFIKRETSVFDRIIDKLIWDEDETILPRNIDIVFFKKRKDEVSDNFGLTIIRLKCYREIKIPEIGDIFISEFDQIFIVEIGYIYLEHEQSIGIHDHYIE